MTIEEALQKARDVYGPGASVKREVVIGDLEWDRCYVMCFGGCSLTHHGGGDTWEEAFANVEVHE